MASITEVEANILVLVANRMPHSMFEMKGVLTPGARSFEVLDKKGNAAQIYVESEMTRTNSFMGRPSGVFRIVVRPASSYSRSEYVSHIKWTPNKTDSAKLDEFWASKVAAACDTDETIRNRRKAEQKATNQAQSDAAEVRRVCGLPDHSSLVSSGYKSYDKWYDCLNIHFRNLTKEQAIAIVKAAQKAGVQW